MFLPVRVIPFTFSQDSRSRPPSLYVKLYASRVFVELLSHGEGIPTLVLIKEGGIKGKYRGDVLAPASDYICE